MRKTSYLVAIAAGFAFLLGACGDAGELPTEAETDEQTSQSVPSPVAGPGPYAFSAPVFDIAPGPDGSILVAQFTTIKQITSGVIRDLAEIPTVTGSAVNGLAVTSDGEVFATSAGLDLAVGAGVWHVSRGGPELVGDVEAFEVANDPDATMGPAWKDPRCEDFAGFSEGPQSNPFHLTLLSDSRALVGDAAGNTVLAVGDDGTIEVVAILTPPEDGTGSWIVLFTLDDGTDCYVQPVATSPAVGPDGSFYVGELTGTTPTQLAGGTSTGMSRVWKIDPDASRPVTCPSADCEVALSGFTSVMDVVFGPDGDLYVLEYDENSWWGAVVVGNPAGGTLNRCDLTAGTCTEVATGLTLPGAIAFDGSGDLWLLESNVASPTVRNLSSPRGSRTGM